MAQVLEDGPNLDPRPRRPIAELLYLAAPTVAQSVSYTIMQFIDTWMLSRLGTDAPTAAGNAGLMAFSVICFGFGMLLVVNTLVSQAYGRREFAECGPYLWQGFWVGLGYSALVLLALPFVPHLFAAFGHPANLAAMEASYLQIVLMATALKLVGTAAGQYLLATNRPNSVLVSAVAGVSVNILAAYAMIFGRFGVGQMGVAGAAWAQNIGVGVETLVLLAFAFRPAYQRRFNVLAWRLRPREAATLVRIGAGSGLQIVADVLAWTMFLLLVIGLLGTKAMAANQFMFRYMVVSFMPAVGISQAVTALVGRYIGMKRFDLAMERANLGFALAAVYMLSCGIGMALFRYPLIRVFTEDPEVVRLGAVLLVFAGVYQVFDAMYVVYNGALRGAGDTFVPAVVTATFCWGITVCGGYLIARHLPGLGVAGPWTASTIYGISLGIFMVVRFRRGGWRAIHLERAEAESNVGSDLVKVVPSP